ncbi:MAG TPA: N-acetyl-gamma-glutamyl-phosphate reductase [Enterococcus columbae]|nr:N-acetyl-gamma-glutamyl-phosphate reductase [Enterococcus columbae]
MKAAIVGVTGYTGIELIRLIQQHPYLTLGTIHRSEEEPISIATMYPHLKGLEATIEAFNAQKIMQENDLVFFATPAGVTKELVAPFVENNFLVIDLSGDLRLKEPSQYESWYQRSACDQEILKQAIYALPEFSIKKGNLLSNPGCYATACNLLLAPLVKNQVIDLDSIIIDAKSGLSGAGKNLTQSSHFVNVDENMTMYKLNRHQHIPEIIQFLQQWAPKLQHLHFTTSLIPVKRGIFVSAYLRLAANQTVELVTNAYRKCYIDQPFVRIQPINQLPQLQQVIGSNYCDIGFGYNKATKILTAVAVIDNLIKGASGQAIQNFNIWAGLPQTTGLMQMPIFP